MRPRRRSIERMFRMRTSPPASTLAKGLTTCVHKGEAACRAGEPSTANPYTSPLHASAWREGWESEFRRARVEGAAWWAKADA